VAGGAWVGNAGEGMNDYFDTGVDFLTVMRALARGCSATRISSVWKNRKLELSPDGNWCFSVLNESTNEWEEEDNRLYAISAYARDWLITEKIVVKE
jgi:hypothetical protein